MFGRLAAGTYTPSLALRGFQDNNQGFCFCDIDHVTCVTGLLHIKIVFFNWDLAYHLQISTYVNNNLALVTFLIFNRPMIYYTLKQINIYKKTHIGHRNWPGNNYNVI